MTDFPKTSEEIAKNLEQSVNTTACTPFLVSKYLAHRAHRYLCNEFFNVCISFIYHLSDNYNKGFYDARNEYACKTANDMVKLMSQDDNLKWYQNRFDDDKKYYQEHQID